jgi:hypothetical protein
MLLALLSVIYIQPSPSNKVQFLDVFQSKTLCDILVQKYGAPQQCPAEYKKTLNNLLIDYQQSMNLWKFKREIATMGEQCNDVFAESFIDNYGQSCI